MKKMKFFALMLITALTFTGCTNIFNPDPKPTSKLPISVTFETSMGGFTTQSVVGDQVWEHSTQYKYMMITGYVDTNADGTKENIANEDWLISPQIDLTDEDTVRLKFDYIARYFGSLASEASVWVSENYVSGLPATANWVQLETPVFFSASDWTTWTTCQASLNDYAGKKINIALKYVSTATKAGTWELKNFLVEKGEVETEEPSAGLQLCDDTTAPVASLIENFDNVTNNADVALANWKVVQVAGDRNWQGKIYTSGSTTETYVQATAHNGGAPNYESWLVTPPLNLDAATSKTLSFKSAKAYWMETSSLKVYVLKCEGGTTTKTELTSAYTAKSTDVDHAFVPSGTIDLSAFSGKIYIGFQYIALGGASNSTTFKIDDVWFNNSATSVVFASQAVTSALVNEAYNYNISTTVMNPSGTTVITATGLPAWATLTDNGNGTAKISGTPTAVGTHAINVQAVNNSITATQAYTLTVADAPISGANILTNGSFETWADNKPSSWSLVGTTTGFTISPETTTFFDGATSCKLDVPSSASGTVSWSQSVAITAGKKYQLSMSYYILSGDGTDARIWSNFKTGATFFAEADLVATGLYSKLRGPGNVNSSGSSYFPDVKGAWNTYVIDFTAPANVDGFDFQFRTYKGAVVYWDKFSLIEIQ